MRDKARLRRQLLELRAAFHADRGPPASKAACARALDAVPVPRSAAVSGYVAIGSELDPRPLLQALAVRGHDVLLPRVVGSAEPLAFHVGDARLPLRRGPLGLREPDPASPRRNPEVLFVPLLAFDRHGFRLGYGKGYYDKTLAFLRARGSILAIGLAFAMQEVPRVPVHGGDRRLDGIVTETEFIDLRPRPPEDA